MRTPSGHLYHWTCLLKWMKQHRTWPNCRQKLHPLWLLFGLCFFQEQSLKIFTFIGGIFKGNKTILLPSINLRIWKNHHFNLLFRALPKYVDCQGSFFKMTNEIIILIIKAKSIQAITRPFLNDILICFLMYWDFFS